MQDTPLPFAVLDALHDLTHAYRSHMRAALHALSLPLTANELRVLLFVGHHPLCTQKDVVARTGTDKAQVARMLKQMEAGQWLERVPHPQDKRSRCLQLSPSGSAAFETLREQRRQLGRHMLQDTHEDQQHQLLELLGQMHRRLGTLEVPGAPEAVVHKASPGLQELH